MSILIILPVGTGITGILQEMQHNNKHCESRVLFFFQVISVEEYFSNVNGLEIILSSWAKALTCSNIHVLSSF